MTREEAIKFYADEIMLLELAPTINGDNGSSMKEEWKRQADIHRLAIAALREQEERNKACPYCDIAKANEGVRNTVLWVKEPETNKCTMMGKKLLFCPMCGRRLKEV